MNVLQLIWNTAKPNFWLYSAGMYAIGFTLGAAFFADYNTLFWLHFIYFLIPANIFLYGTTNYFSKRKKQENKKIRVHEHLIRKKERKTIGTLILVCLLLGMLLLPLQTPLQQTTTIAFFVLALLYNTPPIRLKTRPILDLLGSVVYVLPGILGYVQSAGALPPTQALLAVVFWTAAMHLFSSITKKRKNQYKTTAKFLGKNGSLWICTLLWTLAALYAVRAAPTKYVLYLGFIYPTLAGILAIQNPKTIERTRKKYPTINALTALILFASGALLLA